jgi:hypothetical protein
MQNEKPERECTTWGYQNAKARNRRRLDAGRGTSKLADDVGHRWEETRCRIVELVAGRAS